MARCEDFPCCGHELGCCPDYDESGRQLNMVCTCGKLPVNNRYSICDSCMNAGDENEDERWHPADEDDDWSDDFTEFPDEDEDSGERDLDYEWEGGEW